MNKLETENYGIRVPIKIRENGEEKEINMRMRMGKVLVNGGIIFTKCSRGSTVLDTRTNKRHAIDSDFVQSELVRMLGVDRAMIALEALRV